MDKNAIKTELETIAKKANKPWHTQEVHKLWAVKTVLDLAGVKDQAKRNEVVTKFMSLPASAGCNASALAQWIDPSRKGSKAEATERTFSGY
jgi:hypothetical protein